MQKIRKTGGFASKSSLKLGVLALQGDVKEHLDACRNAAKGLGVELELVEARAEKDLGGLDGLIIPGGESTVFWKLLERENMLDAVCGVPNIFGTCAGLILLSKKIEGSAAGQKSLGLLDISVKRNAYGPQGESFEADVACNITDITKDCKGKVHKVAFIRAPQITWVGAEVIALARLDKRVVGVYSEKTEGLSKRFFMGLAFHPEITGTTYFHGLFMEKMLENRGM